MDKSYAVKRFKQVFREFQRLYPDLEQKVGLTPRRARRDLASPLFKLEEIKRKGELVLTDVKRNLPKAQEVYAELKDVLESPTGFVSQVYKGRVSEYIAMAERANTGDGIRAQQLFNELTEDEIREFFQSPNFVPIGVYGSEDLVDYNNAFGESPLITRLREF